MSFCLSLLWRPLCFSCLCKLKLKKRQTKWCEEHLQLLQDLCMDQKTSKMDIISKKELIEYKSHWNWREGWPIRIFLIILQKSFHKIKLKKKETKIDWCKPEFNITSNRQWEINKHIHKICIYLLILCPSPRLEVGVHLFCVCQVIQWYINI